MSGRKKVICVFITIFILGLVTGIALWPKIFYRFIVNPYSNDFVAKRVFNIRFVEDLKLSPEKEKLVDNLTAKYVSQYKLMEDKFADQRFNLYAGYTNELKSILSKNEYEIFSQTNERFFQERKRYRKEKEKRWQQEREKSKYYNKSYEEAARSMYKSRIPTGTVNDKPYSNNDIYMQYMFDKKQNNWGTFDKSQEVKEK